MTNILNIRYEFMNSININNNYTILSGVFIHLFFQNVYIMLKGLFFNQGDNNE